VLLLHVMWYSVAKTVPIFNMASSVSKKPVDICPNPGSRGLGVNGRTRERELGAFVDVWADAEG